MVHTAGVPPSRGKSIFAITSWTQNSKSALRKIVEANNQSGRELKNEDAQGALSDGGLMSGGVLVAETVTSRGRSPVEASHVQFLLGVRRLVAALVLARSAMQALCAPRTNKGPTSRRTPGRRPMSRFSMLREAFAEDFGERGNVRSAHHRKMITGNIVKFEFI